MPNPETPGETRSYEELLHRARIVTVYRRIRRREAAARMHTALATSGVAIDLSAVDAHRRGQH